MDNVASLRFFWPESVLTLATLSLFIQDLFTRRSPRRVQALTAGALVWLALAAYATWKTPGGTVPLFGGLLQHDPLRMFFAWVFLGLWFIGQFLLPTGSGVAWMAHVGGFIAGAGLVRVLAPRRTAPPVDAEYIPPTRRM